MAPKNAAPTAAAQALGRLGGSANTEAQNAARAKNAQSAGRPKRVCRFCGEPVLGGHRDRRLDETCGAHGWRWLQQSNDPHPEVKPDPALLHDVLHALEEHEASPRLLARVR